MAPPPDLQVVEIERGSSFVDVGRRSKRSALDGFLAPSLDLALLVLIGTLFGTLGHGLGRSATAFLVVFAGLEVAPSITRLHRPPAAAADPAPVLRRVLYSMAIVASIAAFDGAAPGKMALFVAVTTGPAILGMRTGARALDRRFRDETATRALIVGGGEVARRIVEGIERSSRKDLEVVGIVDDDPRFTPGELGSRTVGALSDLPELVRSHHVGTVIVAYSSASESSLVAALREAVAEGASVWVVPRFFELGLQGVPASYVWGVPLVQIAPFASKRPEWWFKRAFDFVAASVGLLVTAPALAAIALGILIESGRPIFFRQTRLTTNGKHFEILKFRTMTVCDETTQQTEWAAAEQRITRFGAFLRATSLDELPQLINVLRGEMSLVGPRPERPYFVEKFKDLYDGYELRHRFPAGMTGWAQVHGLRGDTSIDDRLRFDNHYIDDWNLAKDLSILFRTVPSLLGNREENDG